MCGNSGRREALITFFSFEKVSINIIFLPERQALRFKNRNLFQKRIFS